MNVILYKNTAEINRVDKTNYLTEVLSLEGTLRSECSLTHPIIEVQSTGLLDCNYVYIKEFNRYYLIDDIVSVRNNLWRIEMEVDVLTSYKTEILNTVCAVVRNEYSEINIEDKKMPFLATPRVSVYKVNNPYMEFTERLTLDALYVTVSAVRATPLSDTINGKTKGMITTPASILSGVSWTQYTYRFTDIDEIRKFIGKVLTDTALVPAVMSMYVSPIFGEYGKWLDSTRALIAGTSVDCNCQVLENTFNNDNDDNGCSFTIPITFYTNRPRKWNTLPPYKKAYLFLPFYGWWEIPLIEINNVYLFVRYNFDYSGGKGQIIIYTSISQDDDSAYNILETLDITPFIQISISYNNAADKARNSASNGIRFGVNALNSVIGGFGTLFSAAKNPSPYGTISGVASGATGIITGLISSAGEFAANEIQNVNRGGVSNIANSDFSIFTTKDIYIKEITYQEAISEKQNFSKIYGKPYRVVTKLSDLHGFTLVDDCHLEFKALSTEMDIIKSRLLNGVILP